MINFGDWKVIMHGNMWLITSPKNILSNKDRGKNGALKLNILKNIK